VKRAPLMGPFHSFKRCLILNLHRIFRLFVSVSPVWLRMPMAILTSVLIFSGCSDDEEKQFSVVDSSDSGIEFRNEPLSHERLNILYYIYYYNGAGVATGDINNDGLADIYFAANNRGGNKLYLNKGGMQFQDITEEAGVEGNSDWCTGVTMADVNADGYLDIYVSAVSQKHGLNGGNQLYINNQRGGFLESSAQYGLNFSGYSTQAAFFDYDRDGDLDCYLLNQSDRPYQYIVDTSFRRRVDPRAGDRLFRNDLNGPSKRFVDVTAQAGIFQSNLGYGLGIATADFNNDGWEDIYVGNDFHENDYYYLNNGNGTFTESGASAFNHYSRFSMGNDVADFNNDGHADIITVDMLPPDEKTLKTYGSDERVDLYNFKITRNGYQQQVSRNCLHQNNGNGRSFSDVGLVAGIAATDWSWSPLMADFNNDGNKDIFISSGIVQRPVDLDYVRFVSNLSRERKFNKSSDLDAQALEKMPDGRSNCFLFSGDGKGGFTNQSAEGGIAHEKGYYTGASYSDLDNDGDLDIVVNPLRSQAFIYKNNSSAKSFIQLRARSGAGNVFGYGLKAYVFQSGQFQYGQLYSTRGFQSASDPVLHFGLGGKTVDSVLIVWPDQSFEVIKSPKSNATISIDRKNAGGKFDYTSLTNANTYSFASKGPDISWTHREDKFDDFSVQYLIPHGLSRRGPRIATGDVNGDELDDFFVCGASGQSGQLFLQAADGRFTAADSTAFAQDLKSEDVDAVFIDANGDKKPDLVVVSGGNVFAGNDPALTDRLYLNQGNGKFVKSQGAIPAIYTNKSTVSSGDIDADGDADLFIGSLVNSTSYGMSQTSHLLLNDGTGKFSIAPTSMIDLGNVGMVTSSLINDFNKDGRNDIAIAGEWMSVTVYVNKGQRFEPQRLDSGGLWQSMLAADINNDGHTDIVAGNWGLNTKLAAGKDGPVNLYVKDFDRNGKADQVLSYTIKGEQYPFLPKDEIEQVLPFIKKNFLYAADFAGKPLGQVFELDDRAMTVNTATSLASAIFLNDANGKFVRQNLATQLQLTPLLAFARLPDGISYLAGGNYFSVLPYEGRYDAAALTIFTVDKGSVVNPPRIIDIHGQVTDIKLLKSGARTTIVVARNNEALTFYSLADTPIKK
jgi:enediyne biosynthesis protein E4